MSDATLPPADNSADARAQPLSDVTVRDLGLTDYADVFEQMRKYTHERDASSADQIWLTEHHPVFTQGQAGSAAHLLWGSDIPVVQSDRGGQVTYHGPGQLVAYLLLDLRRLKLGVRDLVSAIEVAVQKVLDDYAITTVLRPDAPGVYVATDKVASLGLRIRKGRSYHGLSLNVAMDLTPFAQINPCGLTDVGVTQISEQIGAAAADAQMPAVKRQLLAALADQLNLNLRTPDSWPS